jgi:hypothetical protein
LLPFCGLGSTALEHRSAGAGWASAHTGSGGWLGVILKHNESLTDLQIDVHHADVSWSNGLLSVHYPSGEHRHFDLGHRTYVRIFNVDWNNGGRWYGPPWQQFPKTVRASITLDGEPTIEEDFRSLHPRLLYAAAGFSARFEDATFDPYAIVALDRGLVKLAVNMLINADTRLEAAKALAEKLDDFGHPNPYPAAHSAIADVQQSRLELAHFWGTGIGRRLQAIDGDIVARVQQDMRRLRIPVLSVHDSFIVPESARNKLVESMDARLSEACRNVPARLKSVIKKCEQLQSDMTNRSEEKV